MCPRILATNSLADGVTVSLIWIWGEKKVGESWKEQKSSQVDILFAKEKLSSHARQMRAKDKKKTRLPTENYKNSLIYSYLDGGMT